MATPSISTTRLSDDYLDRWGRIFTRHRLDRVLGITFEKFLNLPDYWMDRYHATLNSCEHLTAAALRIGQGEYEPPTVQQAKVAEQIYAREIKSAIRRSAQGMSTIDDAELLERAIAAARGIRNVPRQNNGQPVEKMGHHRHPKSRAMFPEGGKS